MRANQTYRASRRNIYRARLKADEKTVTQVRFLDPEFARVDGKNHKQKFDDSLVKYTPPETSGYWPNREDLKHAGKLDGVYEAELESDLEAIIEY